MSKGEVVTEKCGTPVYIAPEVLSKEGYTKFSADIWSTGVLLYTMIYGLVPFQGNSIGELQSNIAKGKYNLDDTVTESARNLLRRILEVNPKKRITIPQILCHNWFADYSPDVKLFLNREKTNFQYDYKELKDTESDWFVEETLSSEINNEQNIASKSIILAPFNTYNNNPTNEDKILEEKVMKLIGKLKNADKEYERNNNCKVDNGVYNYSLEDSGSYIK